MYWKKANYRFYDNAERGVNVARGLWHLRGGGGTTSDELTATRDDVIAGKTAVTKDSDDEAAEGTLVDKVSDTKSVNSWQEQENNYFVDIPQGAYRRKDLNGAGGRVWVEKQRLLNDLGISPGKIATGQKLAGIGGSYTGLGNAAPAQVLAGYTFSSAALSNVPGAVPGNGGGTYTPQPWQQVHQCAGAYMTGNVVINPIPSNYLDISGGQSVFLNGTFGPIVNRGAYMFLPSISIGSGGITKWNRVNRSWSTYNDQNSGAFIKPASSSLVDGVGLQLLGVSNRPTEGVVFMGSISFTKFKRVYVHLRRGVASYWNAKLYVAIVDTNTMVNGGAAPLAQGVLSTYEGGPMQLVVDVSNVNQHAYLCVFVYYSNSGTGGFQIDEIRLEV